ncbi:MAG: M81 family metallopeptidase [Candidatus Bathyarchaeota archaeon]|nr:M81 family metallopeptidase [Candidatus Bathyarchaeota archaeon]
MRIAVASFSHETCTFCPKPTTIEDFEAGVVLYGEDIFEAARGIPNYINGFLRAADEESDVELVGVLTASRSRGGSSGSWLTRECFDKYSNGIADGLKKAGTVDGVLLALHGAMAATGYPKPEAELVRRVRKVVGDKPIMVTLDLHANEDHELTDAADAVFILKTYPHVDSEQIGLDAGRCMIKTLKGEVKPVMAIRKPGVITPSVYQGTGESPGKEIMERVREWEKKEPKCISVSVAFGFAYADVPDVGATVIAVTDDDASLAEKIANDVSDYIWSLREPFAGKTLPKIKEGVKQAIELAKKGKTPVIVADHSDRMGDSTYMLKELIDQKATGFCVATIADDEAINGIEEKPGDKVTVSVGGKKDCYSGDPVEITGTLEYLDDCAFKLTGPMSRGATRKLGKTAVIGFGDNNHVILTQTLHQVLDDALFPAVGLDLSKLDIVAIKSRVHFRAYYNDQAGSIVVIDAPGLGPADLTQHKFENIPDGLYPIAEKYRE